MTTPCDFCDIIAGRSRAYRVYEDEQIFCFLDRDPMQEGHVLVVPKAHIRELVDAPILLQQALMQGITLMSRILQATYIPDGIVILQNGGRFNDIGHLHIHVIPRYEEDAFELVSHASVSISPSIQAARQSQLIRAVQQYLRISPSEIEGV